jgi:Cdc6-like AAA superfamily ATPase
MITHSSSETGRLIQDADALSTESLSSPLVGSQSELETIRAYVVAVRHDLAPTNVWLCGPPGCGKTTLARRVIEDICGTASRLGVYVNCWQHRSLYGVLQAIVDELKMLGADAKDANVKLDRTRQVLRGRSIVIILDEIDRPMPAQRNEIIYGLLNLPIAGLICIAGSIQPLAVLDDRIRSRLSPVVIELAPYSPKEIEAILTERAREGLLPGAWSPALLRRIAVGARGDARLAIQLLRQGAAAAEESRSPRVDWRFIEERIRQLQTVRNEGRLAGLSEHERIIWEMLRKHGPLGTTELARRYMAHCQSHSVQPMARRTFTKYLGRLTAAGMVSVSQQAASSGGRMARATPD